MKSNKFSVSNYTLVSPLIIVLENAGYNLKYVKSTTNVDNYKLTKADCYIPIPILLTFLKEIWLIAETKYFISKFRDCFTFKQFILPKDHFGEWYNLEDAIISIINYTKSKTYISFSLMPLDDRIEIVLAFSGDESLGQRLLEQIWLAALLNLFDEYLNKDWVFSEFHVTSSGISEIRPMLPKGDYLVRYRQPNYKIIFDKNYLRYFLVKDKFTNPYKSLSLIETNNLEKVILSFKDNYRPTLRNIANHFGLTERTMKRYLKDNHTKYSEILAYCMLSKAIKLLFKQNLTIEDISYKLGYSDSPNFIRSFKKCTGITPSVFRHIFIKKQQFNHQYNLLEISKNENEGKFTDYKAMF